MFCGRGLGTTTKNNTLTNTDVFELYTLKSTERSRCGTFDAEHPKQNRFLNS